MRWQKLLAIAAVCPLAVIGVACQRIDQPIGQYSAASSRPNPGAPPVSSSEGATPVPSDVEPVQPADAGSAAIDGSGGVEPSLISTDPTLSTDGAFVPPATMQIPTGTAPGNTARTLCPAAAFDIARRTRLDMYIVLDANISLPYTGLWEFVTSGLWRFITDRRTQGTGVGLRYFGSDCQPDEYNLKPTVEVGVLPNNLNALTDALDLRNLFTASPMAPALEGGIAHQLRRAKANPDTKQIVVLMSDGFTQDLMCRYSRQDVEDQAAKGFTSTPSIETYVIGFGLPDTMSSIADDVLARFAALDPIAEQGGTRKAFNIKGIEDASQLEDALAAIRRTAQPCIYEVPEDVDLAMLNVAYITNNVVPRVDDKAKCGQNDGFFYQPESDASARPKKLELCPMSCNAVQRVDAALVLYTACPTLRR